jgi:hypothetical protein
MMNDGERKVAGLSCVLAEMVSSELTKLEDERRSWLGVEEFLEPLDDIRRAANEYLAETDRISPVVDKTLGFSIGVSIGSFFIAAMPYEDSFAYTVGGPEILADLSVGCRLPPNTAFEHLLQRVKFRVFAGDYERILRKL